MKRLWRRLLRLLGQSRIVLPRRALRPEDLRPGDRLEIGETVFQIRGALRLNSGPWAFRLEELDGTEARPIRLLAIPESPGPWTLIRDGGWVEVPGECVRWFPVGGAELVELASRHRPETLGATAPSILGVFAVEGNVFVNSEDGNLYTIRPNGKLRDQLFLDSALGAAYTPLSIAGDGRILTQNNGHLFVVGDDD